MPDAAWKISLTSKYQLSIEVEGAPLSLDAIEVERLIAELARFRKGMTPEVPRKPPEGKLDPGEIDPILGTQPFLDYMVLLVRHPGIGWLPLFLPEASSQKLGRALLQPLPKPTAPTTPTRHQ